MYKDDVAKEEQGRDITGPMSMTPWLREENASPAFTVAEDLTVGEVASALGISVRTLHHWDAIGLVHPPRRTDAGYRTYSAEDIARVHRVLVYQELGFRLSAITTLLDDPDVDEAEQLRRQKAMIDERILRLQSMSEGVDRLLSAHTEGHRVTTEQQMEIFGRGWREDWAEEAFERWGDSAQWTQFTQNTLRFSPGDRVRIGEDGEQLHADIAQSMRTGVAPDSAAGIALAEEHRAMIGRLFACTPSMHVCLGRLYTCDSRFSASLDAHEPGLSRWLAEAINASARRHGIDPDTAVWE